MLGQGFGSYHREIGQCELGDEEVDDVQAFQRLAMYKLGKKTKLLPT